MPNSDIASPPVAAPVNRMTLGVDSVRLGRGGAADPSFWGRQARTDGGWCFEGSQE